jgi:mannitol/fructose-specific phosphotransferase system IIA component (Ntr-type)
MAVPAYHSGVIKNVLTPAVVSVGLPGRTKEDIIGALLDLACAGGQVRDRDQAWIDLIRHEHEISTGMEFGIAFPHARTTAVDELVAAFGVAQRKINFESLDGKPSQIFALTLFPADRTGAHLEFLAGMSQILKDATNRSRILSAASNDELHEFLTNRF